MEKRCGECGKTFPVSEFYKHAKMADGFLGKCKGCVRSRVRNHREANLERIREYDRNRFHEDPERRAYSLKMSSDRRVANPEAHNAYRRAWVKANPESATASQHKRRASAPEKYAARTALGNAVRDGLVRKMPCEKCGNPKSDGHHEDYSKPLDVVWLCRKHHLEYHRETG